MQPNDFARFNAVMTGMAEVHQRELSTFLLDVYWLAMKDWSLEDFEAAAGHLLQNLKWMPKPSDFTDLRKAGQPTAHEAWDTAVANCTSWRDGKSYAGELIDRVVRSIGGYRAIAMADQERDLPHIQRRFLEAYADLSAVEPAREAVPQIAAVGARKALRGPTPMADFLPNLERPSKGGDIGIPRDPRLTP